MPAIYDPVSFSGCGYCLGNSVLYFVPVAIPQTVASAGAINLFDIVVQVCV